MAEVKKYDHSIFHKPGDEGSEPDQGQADCPNEAAPMGNSHEHVIRPGEEGSELGSNKGMNDKNEMGYQNVPPAPLEQWLQGPEVRRTYVPPAKDANPYDAMPGAN